ncbi:MAG: hypothetical protein H6559_10495 [Lewinellaceae bacterium]|nr:hypothetical protein [Lewinellaceae bacterium]
MSQDGHDQSKSTLMTMEEERRLRWKKSICSEMDFSMSQRRQYFLTICSRG